MRHLRRNERALSEIVGTLILVLIVVSAATLLAAFVASYQKQVQSEAAFSHDQSLESIHILSLNTSLNAAGTAFATFGFTFASEYVNPSTILGISINNIPLGKFDWTNLSTSTSGTYNIGQDLQLLPYDELYITLDLNPGSPTYSFLSSNVPLPDSFLKFDIFTGLQNDFSRVFLPPTALAVVSEINPSGTSPIILFDGSTSFQSGTNATVVEWTWSVNDTTHSANSTSFGGEEAEVSASNFVAGDHLEVSLVVTNSVGLDGSTTLSYVVPP